MTRTLELPEPVYQGLLAAAEASGVSPIDWNARQLPPTKGRTPPTDEERAADLERLLRHAGSIRLGHPTGTDNEQIDADLAREYGSTHEGER